MDEEQEKKMMDDETRRLRDISAGAAARYAALPPEERTAKLPSRSMRRRSRRSAPEVFEKVRREIGMRGVLLICLVLAALIYVAMI